MLFRFRNADEFIEPSYGHLGMHLAGKIEPQQRSKIGTTVGPVDCELQRDNCCNDTQDYIKPLVEETGEWLLETSWHDGP